MLLSLAVLTLCKSLERLDVLLELCHVSFQVLILLELCLDWNNILCVADLPVMHSLEVLLELIQLRPHLLANLLDLIQLSRGVVLVLQVVPATDLIDLHLVRVAKEL